MYAERSADWLILRQDRKVGKFGDWAAGGWLGEGESSRKKAGFLNAEPPSQVGKCFNHKHIASKIMLNNFWFPK